MQVAASQCKRRVTWLSAASQQLAACVSGAHGEQVLAHQSAHLFEGGRLLVAEVQGALQVAQLRLQLGHLPAGRLQVCVPGCLHRCQAQQGGILRQARCGERSCSPLLMYMPMSPLCYSSAVAG